MKKTICSMLTALVALTFGTAALFANDDAEIQRQNFIKGFEQLTKNTEEGLAKAPVKESVSKDAANTKFAIAPVTVSTTTYNIGVKVWFSLEDGTAFNPVKRKMGVKERFYVHIQSAVPVYVSLFQNYYESRPESKQVYPDTKYPDTLKVIQAGVAARLPVAFEMDDDTRDEIMSMVVARADAPQIQSTQTTQATATVTNTGGTATVTAQASAETTGTLKSINDGLAGKGIDAAGKFVIAAPSATAAVTSTVPNDVAFYMLGAGYTGQWQLTLKK